MVRNGSPCPRKALWNRLLEAVFLPGITKSAAVVLWHKNSRPAEAAGAQIGERLVCTFKRVDCGVSAHACRAGKREKLFCIVPGEVCDGNERAFFPQDRIGHGWNIAHMDAAADHPAALAHRTQGGWNELPGGCENDSCIQR